MNVDYAPIANNGLIPINYLNLVIKLRLHYWLFYEEGRNKQVVANSATECYC